MRKSILTALAVFIVSGYIGFSTNYVNTSKASEVVVLQPLKMPQPGFHLNIDLNQGTAVVSDTKKDISVNVNRKDSIVYRSRIKYVQKEVSVEKVIPVRQIPSFAKVHEKPVVLASMANSYQRIQ